jgi:peptidyl-prolyl cis-trans isomerase A (cyclophilin A)
MPASLPRTLIHHLFAATLVFSPLASTEAQAQLPPVQNSVPATPGTTSGTPGTVAATTPPAPALPMLNATFGGRTQQVQVEDLANPMVVIDTNRGSMLFELFPKEAPQIVANFLGLADGSKAWVDPLTATEVQRPFYDGLAFHRVVKDALIQGGSPTPDGQGYPGFFLPDEINAASLGLDRMSVLDQSGEPNPVLGIRDQEDFQEGLLKPLYDSLGIRSTAQLETRVSEVDQKLRALTVQQLFELRGYHYRGDLVSRAPVRGVIAMASTAPDQNGSQFFITLADADWLLGRHTVFGKIRAGLEVLDTIGRANVDAADRPQPEITIMSVRTLPR